MRSNEKPITDLTLSIKVQYLISITPFCNVVLGAHNWDKISCSILKEVSRALLHEPIHPFLCELIFICTSVLQL